MPSPFPGMDPYLEGELWTSFHHEFATQIKQQLTPKLQPRYYAFTEKHFFFASTEELAIESLIPDVGIAEHSSSPLPESQGVATIPVRMKIPMRMPIPHYRLAIRDIEKRRLVTIIEFLSPTNKRGIGRKQYLKKRKQLLESDANLVEIDLLRKGRRAPMQEEYPPGHYFALVSRAEARPFTDVWPIRLQEALPTVPIPLLESDPEVFMDLQAGLTQFYDLGGYGGLIDYRKEPDVPLTPDEAAWADGLLREAGLRSSARTGKEGVIMPSPFPGMDPYLEGSRWPGFHHDLATEVRRQLMQKLRPRYYADTARYFLRGHRRVPHSYVEIWDRERQTLLTAVEFLSPASKENECREQYLNRRRRLLLSPVHLLEIDLLRAGDRLPMEGDLPLASYFVFLSRAEARPAVEVWPILLTQQLPIVPLPVFSADADIALDLQLAFSAVYDLGCYDSILSYADAPDVPLSPREAVWANRILKDAGLR